MWIPLLLALLGTAAQSKEKSSAAERSRIERATGREKEQAIEESQRADVLAEAEQFAPELRQEAMDVKAAESEARISDVLSDNELITSGDSGQISDSLLDQRAKSTRDRANTASILAALTAKVQAPGDAATDEQRRNLELLSRSRGRTGELGRSRRTTDLLSDLMGTENASRMATGGLMQQYGMSGASNSIMSGLNPPSAAPAATNMAQDPYYIQPDAFGVRGVR